MSEGGYLSSIGESIPLEERSGRDGEALRPTAKVNRAVAQMSGRAKLLAEPGCCGAINLVTLIRSGCQLATVARARRQSVGRGSIINRVLLGAFPGAELCVFAMR